VKKIREVFPQITDIIIVSETTKTRTGENKMNRIQDMLETAQANFTLILGIGIGGMFLVLCLI
jgi:hypothetical protein